MEPKKIINRFIFIGYIDDWLSFAHKEGDILHAIL